jgi:dTDP-4-dehydrorhamnose 3,5-epimerase
MQIIKSPKLNLNLIIPAIKEDYRGTFVEHYNEAGLTTAFKTLHFVRDCLSTSTRHVLRGIHYDDKTWKLIQCMAGRIYFVVVDMREESADYLKWESFILSDRNRMGVLVPPRFGNGHLVLSKRCTFHYKMSEYYDPQTEKTLAWNDPKAAIFWPIKNPLLSEKDSSASFLQE